MTAIYVAIGLVVVVVVMIFLIIPVALRLSAPHSSRMIQEQIRLDRHSGKVRSETVPERRSGGRALERVQKYLKIAAGWSMTIGIIALCILLWWLYNTNVTLAQASDWARGHWAFVVLAAIALGVIIAKTMKARATTLIWLLGAATLALLLAEPVGAWVSEISLPQVTCQDPSSQKALTCLLNTKDSSWMKPAEGVADDGMRICYTPSSLIEFEYRLVNGTSFYRFRAKEGHVLMTYRLHKIPPGEECRQV